MIRVFISYSKTDERYAKSLYDCLKKEEPKIKPIFAPELKETVIENAEMIANNIDTCNFFITFYTTDGKKIPWVNQELGYAFNHIRQNGLKIIPIYDDRTDFEGFLTSQSHNFYKGFQLKKEKPEETMEDIKKYLMEEYKHPLKLKFKIKTQSIPSPTKFTNFDAIISIENCYSKKIQDASLDFVFSKYNPDDLTFIIIDLNFIKTRYNSTVLPESHSTKISNPNNNNINRYNLLLRDILGLNVYEIPLSIAIPNKLKKIAFVVYLNIPLYGTTYYQTYLQHDDKTGWSAPLFNRKDNKNDMIYID